MEAIAVAVTGRVALVLAVSLLLGGLARRCGQPRVVGQLLGGIMLGPSVLGRLPGHLESRLFPPAVLPPLTALAQLAVVVFMFVVGYELDWRWLRGRAAPLIAVASLLVPMGLGAGAAVAFRSQFASLGQPSVSPTFVLFLGVAVSITALPVMAAIVRERGLAGSVAAATAVAAAGIMDVAAWLLLAVAMAGSGTSRAGQPWPVRLLFIAAFVAIMLGVVRPALRLGMSRRRALLSNPLPAALLLALGSAWVTSSLGFHPVFGGFLAGLAMPKPDDSPDPEVLRPLEDVGGLLLPLFFAVTGLSVTVSALGGTALAMLAVISAIAVIGKLCPGYLASRAGGMHRRDAATVAALVNARGLTELIALGVGLSAGIIGQQLFSVLVLMALLTTIMTTPLLSLIRAPAATAPPATRPTAPAALRTGAPREPVAGTDE
jgi:Kef-type K+ transport system membrane component KefB